MFQAPVSRCVYCLEWQIVCHVINDLSRKAIYGKHYIRNKSFDKQGDCECDSATFEVSPYGNIDAHDFENMWLPMNSTTLYRLARIDHDD